MIINTIFPWQQTEWQKLWQSYQQKRFPHALLFSGISGIGKMHFARQFAHSILCHSPDKNGIACQECRSCHLLKASTHADIRYIEPEESAQTIKIDQIRHVIEFVNETAQQDGYRIIIINPANAMNLNASNALLKVLEEPTENCLFILISHQTARLLPTIKSRCQEVLFQKPNQDIALAWLKTRELSHPEQLLHLANGAPLKAIELSENNFLTLRHSLYQGLIDLKGGKEDPLLLAARLADNEILKLLSLMHSWLLDLLRFILVKEEKVLTNVDFRDAYYTLSQTIAMSSLLDYINYVQEYIIKASESNSLNKQLLLEELLIRWMRTSR